MQAHAAIAIGVAGVFKETHKDLDKAPSDRPNMVKCKDLPAPLETPTAFVKLAKRKPG